MKRLFYWCSEQRNQTSDIEKEKEKERERGICFGNRGWLCRNRRDGGREGRGGAVGRKSDGGQTIKLQAETVWGHLDWVRLVIPATQHTHTHTHTHTQAAATETSCSLGLHHSLHTHLQSTHLLKSTKTHNDVSLAHLNIPVWLWLLRVIVTFFLA